MLAPFQPVIKSPFPSDAVATPTSWFLLGGVTAAQCVVAYQPKGAASLAASYTNLNNPGTNDAAPGTAPTLGVSGWTFNGTTQYLKTGVAPTQSYSIIVQFSNRSGVGADQCLIGERESNKGFNLLWESPSWYFQNAGLSGGSSKTTPSFDAGNLCIAGLGCYKNGGSVETLGSVTFASSYDFYIGAAQISPSTASFFYGGNVAAVAIYNITLSSTQVGLIAAAMAAL